MGIDLNLNDKVVLITGASSGIGAATAIIFAKEGANVVITGRNEANLKSVGEKCESIGKKAFPIKADITKDDEAKGVISKTIEKFGKLDVLVNNAGIYKISPFIAEDTISTFDDILNTNLRAVIVLTYEAVPHLIKSKGNIVNISSIAGTKLSNRHIAYATSKAALNNFSQNLAVELAEKGVRVNIVSPGPVDTPIFETSGVKMTQDGLKSMTALNRVCAPEEVGDLIAYLASEKAGSITGSNYTIDCGTNLK